MTQARFEEGKTYWLHYCTSPVAIGYKVVRRTAKMVTLQDADDINEPFRCRIHGSNYESVELDDCTLYAEHTEPYAYKPDFSLLNK